MGDGAVGLGHGEGGVGVQFEVPAGHVNHVVVPVAQQNQVVGSCGAAPGPVFDVVGVAPGVWTIAAWVSTPAVAKPRESAA